MKRGRQLYQCALTKRLETKLEERNQLNVLEPFRVTERKDKVHKIPRDLEGETKSVGGTNSQSNYNSQFEANREIETNDEDLSNSVWRVNSLDKTSFPTENVRS